MKKAFAMVLIATAVVVLSSSLGVFAGKELAGRERLYVGLKLEVGDNVRIGVDALYPVSSFENVSEELKEVKILEIDPLIILSFGGEDYRLYAGMGPMVIFNIDTSKFALYSMEILRLKAGLAVNTGFLSVFLEGSTAFSYSPEFSTTGVYSVRGGVALGF